MLFSEIKDKLNQIKEKFIHSVNNTEQICPYPFHRDLKFKGSFNRVFNKEMDSYLNNKCYKTYCSYFDPTQKDISLNCNLISDFVKNNL